MKIMHLCLSHGLGGLELYPIKVLKWQKEIGLFCHAAVSPKSFIAERLQKESIPYVTINRWSEYIPFFAAYRLARLFEVLEIDVLHMHHRSDLLTAVVGKCLSRRPVKLVYTRHMGMSKSKKDIYHSFIFRHVDRFLCVSGQIYKQALKNLTIDSAKIKRLYLGVPESKSDSKNNCRKLYEQLGINNKSFKIGIFGRVTEAKGQRHLVEATKGLIRKGNNVTTLIVGTPMEEAFLKSILDDVKSCGLKKQILYYGFHERPMDIMGCFDVVVLASNQEAFGLVLVEAMRCGTVVIGTDAGGVPEIIKDGETGLLVKPRESESLEAALERLIKDPALCSRLAEDGKKFADEMFSEETHFVALEKIYREILA